MTQSINPIVSSLVDAVFYHFNHIVCFSYNITYLVCYVNHTICYSYNNRLFSKKLGNNVLNFGAEII